MSLPLGAGGRARRSHGGSSSASLRRRHSSQTKGDLTRWGGREGGREHGRGEGKNRPTPRCRPRAAPARPLQIRPAAPLSPPTPPRPSPTLKSTSPPASCARRGPSQGAAAAACCARLHGPGPEAVGCRGERAGPSPGPSSSPRKGVGGWSPERSFQRWIPAKLRQLTSACDLLSPPFSCSLSLSSPLSLTPKAKKTSETCCRRRLLGL